MTQSHPAQVKAPLPVEDRRFADLRRFSPAEGAAKYPQGRRLQGGRIRHRQEDSLDDPNAHLRGARKGFYQMMERRINYCRNTMPTQRQIARTEPGIVTKVVKELGSGHLMPPHQAAQPRIEGFVPSWLHPSFQGP